MLQLVVLTVLFFVMMFGIGFILNMLMKTTWFPVYLFFLIVVPLVIYAGWSEGSLMDNLAEYSYVDYITALGGLVGAVISGKAIQFLRNSGYKMF
ncbi:YuiB family protein [Paenibacillus gansuensis]|uniref:YuiB family protein n=1 Tax=Paenibacillus gansuensis TaxID=306542 RepID=A0ABW5PI57_9BACL